MYWNKYELCNFGQTHTHRLRRYTSKRGADALLWYANAIPTRSSSQIFDLSKNRTKTGCNAGSLVGNRSPNFPKLNIPKRCVGKRFSRSGCPKRAVTGNGRARGRACGARAPRGAKPKPLRNPHVAPPTTPPDVTSAWRGPLVCMTRYGMASGGR